MIVALGVGLLVGAERERRHRAAPAPAAAGIRTFTIAALVGVVGMLVGGATLLAVVLAVIGGLVAISYWQARDDEDRGLTTETALVATVLIGALAVSRPMMAAAVGVVLAVLLAARTPLHRFVGSVLTPQEGRDALILAAATLVVLPLLPDQAMGPYHALNPRSVWMVVVLVLAIGAAGHMVTRALGARVGLPVSGLVSGFVSSTATIGAMGGKAKRSPAILPAAVAGAVLSTVATVVQMAGVLAAVSFPTLVAMTVPLVFAGGAACIYGAAFTLRAFKAPAEEGAEPGHAFSLMSALGFAAIVCVVLVGAAALRAHFGQGGAIVAAGLAGLLDAHAAAISIAAMVASGDLAPQQAVTPILVGLTTNTVSKVVLALAGGGPKFALLVVPGLFLVAAAAWLGAGSNWSAV